MPIFKIPELVRTITSFSTYRDLLQLRLCSKHLHEDTVLYSFSDRKLLEFVFRYKDDPNQIDEIKKDYWGYIKEKQSLEDKIARQPFLDFIKIISFPFLHQEDLDEDVFVIASNNRLSLSQTMSKLSENIKYEPKYNYKDTILQCQSMLQDTDHFMRHWTRRITDNGMIKDKELRFMFMTRSLYEVKELLTMQNKIPLSLLCHIGTSADIQGSIHYILHYKLYSYLLRIRPEFTDPELTDNYYIKHLSSLRTDQLMRLILKGPPIVLEQIFNYDLRSRENDKKCLITPSHIKSVVDERRSDLLSLIWDKYKDTQHLLAYHVVGMIEAAPCLAGSIYNRLKSIYRDVNNIPFVAIPTLIKSQPLLTESILPSLNINNINKAIDLARVSDVEGKKIVIDKYANHDNDIAWIFHFIYNYPEISEYIWEKYKYRIKDIQKLSNIYKILDNNLKLATCVNLYNIISKPEYDVWCDGILGDINSNIDINTLEQILDKNILPYLRIDDGTRRDFLFLIMKLDAKYSKMIVHRYVEYFGENAICNFVIKNPEFFNIIYDKVPITINENIHHITQHNPEIFDLFLEKCPKGCLLYYENILHCIISHPSFTKMVLEKYPGIIRKLPAYQLVKHDPSLIHEVFKQNAKLSLATISNILDIVPDFAADAVNYCHEHHIAVRGTEGGTVLAHIMEYYMLQQIQDVPLLM